MTKFYTGDLVRATKGDEIRQGAIREGGWFVNGMSPAAYEGAGWNVELVRSTTPQLPTEPGAYESISELLAHDNYPYILIDDVWSIDGSTLKKNEVPTDLRRLATVAETAKAIRARIDEMRACGQVSTLADVQEIIAKEFEVSE